MDETLKAVAMACAVHRAGLGVESDDWVQGATAILAAVLTLEPDVLLARTGHEKHDG